MVWGEVGGSGGGCGYVSIFCRVRGICLSVLIVMMLVFLMCCRVGVVVVVLVMMVSIFVLNGRCEYVSCRLFECMCELYISIMMFVSGMVVEMILVRLVMLFFLVLLFLMVVRELSSCLFVLVGSLWFCICMLMCCELWRVWRLMELVVEMLSLKLFLVV